MHGGDQIRKLTCADLMVSQITPDDLRGEEWTDVLGIHDRLPRFSGNSHRPNRKEPKDLEKVAPPVDQSRFDGTRPRPRLTDSLVRGLAPLTWVDCVLPPLGTPPFDAGRPPPKRLSNPPLA